MDSSGSLLGLSPRAIASGPRDSTTTESVGLLRLLDCDRERGPFSSSFALAGIRGALTLLLVSALARLADLFDFKTRRRRRRKGCGGGGGRRDGGTLRWVVRLSGMCSAAVVMVLLSPSLQTFPPAEAIRSSHYLRFPGGGYNNQLAAAFGDADGFGFRRAPSFNNAAECEPPSANGTSLCDPSLVHVAITLDEGYLRGSIAVVHSVLAHAACPESVFFHFLVSESGLESLVRSTFPGLRFKAYYFHPDRVRGLISASVRQALEQPLNYARNYLADILERCVSRVIYLDSDLVVVDDIAKLWRKGLGSRAVGAPEYCHANFTKYFTDRFWSDRRLASAFAGRRPCYFNTGGHGPVLVRPAPRVRFRRPPALLLQHGGDGARPGPVAGRRVHAADRAVDGGAEERRRPRRPRADLRSGWNQHGLGGDNINGSCRDLHPGPVSLLHWSGSGKPWVRLDSNHPCPLDNLWAPYDLYGPALG
ncbi:hypothetical protein B296_00047238 [Ensete ventricosum]|uniref:Hexosyltransferase n=1 Tax=Ensete ventricosum TaxID=4639 RepID=A0A426X6Z4_ENSVE|nr:hypothetical protein B296_00047238 [Ensete ventricosum]